MSYCSNTKGTRINHFDSRTTGCLSLTVQAQNTRGSRRSGRERRCTSQLNNRISRSKRAARSAGLLNEVGVGLKLELGDGMLRQVTASTGQHASNGGS